MTSVKSRWRLEASSVARGCLERRDDVLTGDDSNQLLNAVEHDDTPDAVLDHDLEHARQSRVGTDIDEFGRHDVADLAAHQLVIARQHLARRERKALQDVELGDEPDDLPLVLDGVAIEV